MRTKIKTALIVGVALAVTPLFAAPPHGHGTDVLHLSIREAMVNTGAEPGSGTIQVSENNQGKANKQSLTVLLKGLAASTDYSLMATTVSNSTPTDIEDFTTDKKGNAALHFISNAKGKKNIALPDAINPVSQISELDVVDVGTSQTVLTTSGASNNVVQYLVKRNLTSDDGSVTGVLQIKATSKKTSFSLKASGLQPSTDYQLFLNGSDAETVTTDAKGNLNVHSAPTPANILDLNSVQLQDGSGNVILSTTWPE
jgi:hypothetical protein